MARIRGSKNRPKLALVKLGDINSRLQNNMIVPVAVDFAKMLFVQYEAIDDEGLKSLLQSNEVSKVEGDKPVVRVIDELPAEEASPVVTDAPVVASIESVTNTEALVTEQPVEQPV